MFLILDIREDLSSLKINDSNYPFRLVPTTTCLKQPQNKNENNFFDSFVIR